MSSKDEETLKQEIADAATQAFLKGFAAGFFGTFVLLVAVYGAVMLGVATAK